MLCRTVPKTGEKLSRADTYGRLMKIGCTGCQYCIPCPAGVDIQGCFEMYNNVHMFGGKRFLRFFYIARMGGIMGGKTSNASLCVRCGYYLLEVTHRLVYKVPIEIERHLPWVRR